MADSLDQRLSPEQLRTVTLAHDKGASGWLNVLPLEDEGYVLNKEEFRNALALRYNKSIPNLPSQCPCGKSFNPTHAMVCKTGGFIHAPHDNVKNLEASLLSRVCKDVAIEPSLLPVTGEEFVLRSANFEDDSRLDVKARGFYRQGQTAFFDIILVLGKEKFLSGLKTFLTNSQISEECIPLTLTLYDATSKL